MPKMVKDGIKGAKMGMMPPPKTGKTIGQNGQKKSKIGKSRQKKKIKNGQKRLKEGREWA